MKVVQYKDFGGVDVLKQVEISKPSLKPAHILVKVKAVSINPLDWKIRNGEMKLMSGKKFPKRIGVDFAGVVEATASDSTQFSIGDEVFGAVNGMKEGALGEYVLVEQNNVYKKPSEISFSQAASIPIVGAGAYEAIEKLGKVSSGQKVLINGATGGMGMFALQLAKQKGAIVTGVANTNSLELANDWGADKVVDYTKKDITAKDELYDVIFDLSGKLPFKKAKQILKPKGVYINPVPNLSQIISTAIVNPFRSQKHKILLSSPTNTVITKLLKAVENGLKIHVSKEFPFREYQKAYEFAEKGGYNGKLIIHV